LPVYRRDFEPRRGFVTANWEPSPEYARFRADIQQIANFCRAAKISNLVWSGRFAEFPFSVRCNAESGAVDWIPFDVL